MGENVPEVKETNKKRSFWLVALVGFVVWATLTALTLEHNADGLYGYDPAAYLETAQSILEGRGLSHRTIAGFGPDIWEPLSLWPPGHPILIAVAHWLGVPMPTAAVAVSVASGAVFVFILAGIANRLFTVPVALTVLLSIVVMPAFLRFTNNSWSESPYIACSAAAIALALAWSERTRHSLALLFAAGLLCGAAWCVRNTGVALFASISAFVVFRCLWERFSLMSALGVWNLGVFSLYGPLLARNRIRFGAFNPYTLPPSDLSLQENAVAGAATIVEDLSGGYTDVPAALLAVFLSASVYVFLKSARLKVEWARRWCGPFLLASYPAAFVCLVVVARSHYKWGEPIYSRYMVPIYWTLLLAGAAAAVEILRFLNISGRRRTAIVTSGFAILLGIQARAEWRELRGPRPNFSVLPIGNSAAAKLKELVSEKEILLASRADLLRIFSNLNARTIPSRPFGEGPYFRMTTETDISEGCESGLLWGLVEDDPTMRLGNYGLFIERLTTEPERFPWLVHVDIGGANAYRCR